MSRPGRKRKSGAARKPGGRIRQKAQDVSTPGYWNKFKHGLRRQVMDQHYDTTLGELHFHGHITDSQFHVAIKYFLPLVTHYDEVQEYRRSERALSYERVEKGQEARDEKRDELAVKKYNDAHGALVSSGLLAEKWTHEAVRDRYVPSFQVRFVKEGLTALVIHFKLKQDDTS
jgi:hypothetical protein